MGPKYIEVVYFIVTGPLGALLFDGKTRGHIEIITITAVLSD